MVFVTPLSAEKVRSVIVSVPFVSFSVTVIVWLGAWASVTVYD